MDVIDQLIAKPPAFHLDRQCNLVSYGVSEDLLRYLERAVQPGMRTLETGAGLSTIVFAARGAEHDVVMPEGGLADRIRAYAATCGVSLEQVSFHVAPSERVLPSLSARDLHLALIDGRHAFPTPFLDWYYLAPMLAVGGRLIVDDTQLWTGRVLKDFLCEEPEWHLDLDFPPRTSVFVKLDEGSHHRVWDQQPYVARLSRKLARFRRLKKWYRRLTGAGRLRTVGEPGGGSPGAS